MQPKYKASSSTKRIKKVRVSFIALVVTVLFVYRMRTITMQGYKTKKGKIDTENETLSGIGYFTLHQNTCTTGCPKKI